MTRTRPGLYRTLTLLALLLTTAALAITLTR